jgi:hypothetical protein
MDENEAMDKMRELKKSIDTALRYERSGEKLPEVFLIILMAILAADLVAFSVNLYNLETLNPFLGNILVGNTYFGIGIPVLLLFAIFALVVYRILHRPFTVPSENSWDEYLKEGVIGIMRIIEISDWEKILINLNKAKQAFTVLSTMTFLLNLGIIFIILFFAYAILITGIFGIPTNLYLVLLGSVLMALGVGDKMIRKSYSELWHMDNLVAELRWFYTELQNREI